MNWVLFGIAIAVLDATVVAVVMWFVMRSTFGPLAESYPPRDPLPDAVVRRSQSFRFGLINMGRLIHVAADDDHLHLVPARVMRWLGARAISVPWEALSNVEPVGFRQRWRRAKLGRLTILGPPWCLDLARGAAEGASGAHSGSGAGTQSHAKLM